ncbi:mechanosensitive ion channel [Candidatus Woesearchaeota archaeon]|nr:mechanosensitive ion channel [Candidatus Woesearchaeota archaeon]
MNISLIILNIIVFIIIILFGLIIARVLSNLSKKIIDEFEIGRITSNKFKDYAPEIIKYIVYFFGLVIALDAIGIRVITFKILGIIIVVLIGITVLLAAGDFFPNFIRGLKIKSKYKINDIIKVKNISGRIIKKDLTEIQIENEHETVHVPYLMLK